MIFHWAVLTCFKHLYVLGHVLDEVLGVNSRWGLRSGRLVPRRRRGVSSATRRDVWDEVDSSLHGLRYAKSLRVVAVFSA